MTHLLQTNESLLDFLDLSAFLILIRPLLTEKQPQDKKHRSSHLASDKTEPNVPNRRVPVVPCFSLLFPEIRIQSKHEECESCAVCYLSTSKRSNIHKGRLCRIRSERVVRTNRLDKQKQSANSH
jgi:hypothetical protein